MLNWKENLKSLLNSQEASLRFDEPMSAHTTFRIGGPAKVFVCPGNEEELASVLILCGKENIPYAILGNGSNLLVSDSGFDGVVISLEKHWSFLKAEGTKIRAGAGQFLSRIARLALENGLTGLEFASGIPGTAGGALVMNAGAYGSEMKDVLVSAKVMTAQGEILTLSGEELELGYRRSNIPEKGYIVLEVLFELKKGNPDAISARMRELAGKRREKQPLEYPSAGSTFKRPEGNFAGKLIEEAGLRGFQIGGAQVSEKHCGFVVNRGGATAKDVMELCDYIKERVKETSGVELEMEVKRLGFDKQR